MNTQKTGSSLAWFSLSRTPLRAAAALATLLGAAMPAPAWADPAQSPLLTRSENPAKPNVVYTFDDSGSMSYSFMPDNMNGWFNASDNITLARRIFFHPSDDSANNASTPYTMTTRQNDLWSARLRSSSWNTIYYNPNIRYQPWYRSNGTQFPEYPASKAPLEPTSPSTTVDLSSSTNYGTSVSFCRSTSNSTPNRTNNDTSSPTCGTLNATGETIWHATYYEYNSSTGVYTRRRIATSDISYPVSRPATRTDCTVSSAVRQCSQAQELQNFSNWFTYYRTRNKLAIAASTRAFSALEEGGLRLGYGRINKTNAESIDNVSTKTLVRGVRTYIGTDKDSFFTFLHNMPASGGTPLRRAMDDIGKYYQRTDNRGPWGNTPGTDDGVAVTTHLQCRKSYHILMTDGFWNGDPASNTINNSNVDNVQGPTITGPNSQSYRYVKARPYQDANEATTGTLADVAMYYWNRDLRTDLDNRVKPDAKDPAFWQHMVNFTVGLGVGGTLNYPDDLAALQAGTKNWPVPAADSASAVDDLWHAALNSRGEYLSAKDPDEFANSLASILTEITVRNASEGGVAATAATLQAGNRKYVPEYKTAIWTGNLTAYELDQFGQQLSPIWNAATALPAHGSRNIFVGTRNGTPKAETFTWAGMSSGVKADLPGATENLVNYLRGDATYEAGLYRERSSRLGDFVNSQPVYVKSLVDMQYNFLPSSNTARTTYKQFLTDKAARTGVVFIGGNDGMLHAFRDSDGREIFGFIPRILLQYLPALASTSYEHRFYVDGQLTESDAYLGGSWKNVLVGGTGAGARAVFALDVTNTSAMGASNVLWEMDSTTQAEMGYVMAPIEVGLMKNGQWAAIFGNGPSSNSGTAQLFIVNLQTGALISRIQASTTTGNGLGGVRVIRDANRVIVGAYAGDLLGNVWKFDLASTSSGSWGVSFGGTPLFQAGNTKPITAAPQYLAHPLGGYMVLVGTGKLYDEGDQATTTQQALYGLWDKQQLTVDSNGAAVWATITPADAQVLSSALANHAFNSTTISGPDGAIYYRLTTSPLNWATQRGWTLPLTIVGGHRNLLSPTFIFGYALFETMSPTTQGALNPCDDTGTGGAYNLLINPIDGTMPQTALFDTNGDGYVNSSDTIVAGYRGTWDGRDVVLTQKPCLNPDDCPPDPENRCEDGTKLVSVQSALGGNSNICVKLPPRERWWWRQIQQVPE